MSKPNNKVHKIFISAGEVSGDNLGAELINSLKKEEKDGYKFYGIAGYSMQKAGNMKSIFPMEELSVTGYLEIVPKLFKILFRLLQTAFFIKKLNPHLIITIDAPGFHFRLVKLVHILGMNTHIIHYVAPTVWAYKPERAKKCARLFDHIMVIFPFEKKYFDEVGLKCSYVGNPTINKSGNYTDKEKNQIKQKYGMLNKKIISIMPGSRKNELKYHLPILKEFIQEMNNAYDDLCFIIHALSNTEEEVKRYFDMRNAIILKEEVIKRKLVDVSDLIICKSGTSVLESVAKVIPIIAFYKMSALTAYLVEKKLKIKYVTICNIVMNQAIIPELLQKNLSTQNLLRESKKLLYDNKERNKQIKGLKSFLSRFNEDANGKIEKPKDVIKSYLTSILNSV